MSTLIFRSSLKRQVYSSDPYKILNLLGDIGGYLELIMALGFAMAHYFVQHEYLREIMSSAYQVQRYNDNKSEYYPSNTARKCIRMIGIHK